MGLFLLAVPLAFGCRTSGSAASPSRVSTAGEHAPAAWLTEITESVGLPAPAERWPDGTFFLPEIIGAGVGLLDYDRDGRLDVLQVRHPPPGARGAPAQNRLFRQRADGTFTDVTAVSGIGDPGYGQAVAVADHDRDGDLDVYFANYGPDAFYVNNGDGTFTDRTRQVGIDPGDAWSSAAAFCDYDRDGDLDLYVTHYLRYDYRGDCLSAGAARDYCNPAAFDGVADTLYRNDGERGFTDVTAAAALRPPDAGRSAKGLGVVCLDLTGDGWADFYVANDGELNHLWVNHGDGTFEEQAVERGVAVNRHGLPEASMGVVAADVDDDGRLDLFTTHLTQENNRLYRGSETGSFTDVSVESGLSRHDLALTGWGCGLLDLDLDGDLDLAVVNGRVYRGPAGRGAGRDFWSRYAQPNLLLANDGAGRFSALDAEGGAFVTRVEVSRGLAWGDLDRDGDPDLVVSNCDDSLRAFRNDAPAGGRHWLRVRALDGDSDALGARVRVVNGDRIQLRVVLPHSSYQSSSEAVVHFGLAAAERVDFVEVEWPVGEIERFAVGGVDREVVVRRGEGMRS